MVAWIKTPTGANYKRVLQLEALFIDAKTCIFIGARTWSLGYQPSALKLFNMTKVDNKLENWSQMQGILQLEQLLLV